MRVPTLEEQNAEIRAECQRLADFLVAKNTAYGGQALAPIAIVSKGDPLDIIFARMDDKLSRILRGQAAGEDPWQDLRGYITLWQVVNALKKKGFYSKEDPKPTDNSAMPMPISMRYEQPAGPQPGTKEFFDIVDEDNPNGPFDGGTPEQAGNMVIGEADDPLDLPVQDLNAIASQTVVSIAPKVPETFEEVTRPENGTNVAGETDPWSALMRPTRRRNSGGASITPEGPRV